MYLNSNMNTEKAHASVWVSQGRFLEGSSISFELGHQVNERGCMFYTKGPIQAKS